MGLQKHSFTHKPKAGTSQNITVLSVTTPTAAGVVTSGSTSYTSTSGCSVWELKKEDAIRVLSIKEISTDLSCSVKRANAHCQRSPRCVGL